MLMYFVSFFLFAIIFYIFERCKRCKKRDKSDKNNFEPFILSFRKTRTEACIIAKVEEISKSRDIQFVISSYYYNTEKTIKGCVYVITSKILYKLFFVKQNLVVKEIHKFTSFLSILNKKVYNNKKI